MWTRSKDWYRQGPVTTGRFACNESNVREVERDEDTRVPFPSVTTVGHSLPYGVGYRKPALHELDGDFS